MQKTFASYVFGCRVNQAEKEELDRQLSVAGFRYSENNPDIYIINTCAVTGKAEREARQFIYQTRKKYPKAKIIVTGCATTKWINEKVKIKEADWMIGNKNKESIGHLISNLYLKSNNYRSGTINIKAGGARKNVILGRSEVTTPESAGVYSLRDSGQARMTYLSYLASKKILYASEIVSDKFLPSGRLLIKIQDGCQRYCTYCIVPYLRGTPRSEKIKNIESRIMNYGNKIKEVILTAINTEAYGLDTGESFIDLLNKIIKHTKVERVSLGSINPWSINREFFNFYKKVLPQKRLVNFFHIPLQSGSNKILSLMKRGYTREEFREKLNTFPQINPFSFIGTDIIVGFLDETDRDFEDTYNFLKDSPISKFHIFRFSVREKTAAYYMSKTIKEPSVQVKIKRAKILASLGKIKYRKFISKHLGKNFSALFLQRRIENFQEVLLDNQIPAFIKTSKNWTGEIKQIKIDSIKIDKLTGRIV